MSQSQVIDFLAENEYRKYPFTQTSDYVSVAGYRLPLGAIVDCNIYSTTNTYTRSKLISITRSGLSLLLIFTDYTVTIPNITSQTFPFYTERNANGSYVVLGEDSVNIPVGTHTFSNMYVLSTLVFDTKGMWEGVTQLGGLPNIETRTDGSSLPVLPLGYITDASQMAGDIIFLSGYNLGVNIENGKINMQASRSAGIPLSCDDSFISGDLKDCGEIISYINGVPPNKNGTFTFVQGQNMNIFAIPETSPFQDEIDTVLGNGTLANTHTLFIGLTFEKTDICAPITPSIPT